MNECQRFGSNCLDDEWWRALNEKKRNNLKNLLSMYSVFAHRNGIQLPDQVSSWIHLALIGMSFVFGYDLTSKSPLKPTHKPKIKARKNIQTKPEGKPTGKNVIPQLVIEMVEDKMPCQIQFQFCSWTIFHQYPIPNIG